MVEINIHFVKTIFVLIAFLILFACERNKQEEFKIEAIYVSTAPLIDGIQDPLWQKTKPIVLKENQSGKSVTNLQLITEVKACYNDSNLYFLFKCQIGRAHV